MKEDTMFETTAIIDIDEQLRKEEELMNTIKMEPILEKTTLGDIQQLADLKDQLVADAKKVLAEKEEKKTKKTSTKKAKKEEVIEEETTQKTEESAE